MNYKHGLKHTRQYRIWLQMKNRCFNKRTGRYKDYGGRGISVCDEWRNDFKAFYDWSMLNGYGDDLTIDRINNDGNYEPCNCRWVTMKVQNRNSRHCHTLSYNGETHTVIEWAEKLGVSRHLISNRINAYGWSVEDALTKPKGYNQGVSKNRRGFER